MISNGLVTKGILFAALENAILDPEDFYYIDLNDIIDKLERINFTEVYTSNIKRRISVHHSILTKIFPSYKYLKGDIPIERKIFPLFNGYAMVDAQYIIDFWKAYSGVQQPQFDFQYFDETLSESSDNIAVNGPSIFRYTVTAKSTHPDIYKDREALYNYIFQGFKERFDEALNTDYPHRIVLSDFLPSSIDPNEFTFKVTADFSYGEDGALDYDNSYHLFNYPDSNKFLWLHIQVSP